MLGGDVGRLEGEATNPCADATLMMRPNFSRRIAGKACCVLEARLIN